MLKSIVGLLANPRLFCDLNLNQQGSRRYLRKISANPVRYGFSFCKNIDSLSLSEKFLELLKKMMFQNARICPKLTVLYINLLVFYSLTLSLHNFFSFPLGFPIKSYSLKIFP